MRTTEGKAVMHGSESSRPAAKSPSRPSTVPTAVDGALSISGVGFGPTAGSPEPRKALGGSAARPNLASGATGSAMMRLRSRAGASLSTGHVKESSPIKISICSAISASFFRD